MIIFEHLGSEVEGLLNGKLQTGLRGSSGADKGEVSALLGHHDPGDRDQGGEKCACGVGIDPDHNEGDVWRGVGVTAKLSPVTAILPLPV